MTYNLGNILYLSVDRIDEEVKKEKFGIYVLDRGRTSFRVFYVGRSDVCLNTRLKEHVGEKYGGSTYEYFKYDYATSVNEAYEKECECYHDNGGSDKLDNDAHPKKPENSNLNCPVCGE
jgi:hypothetical protein